MRHNSIILSGSIRRLLDRTLQATCTFAAAGILLGGGNSADAAILTWDPNVSAGAAVGGSGVWDLSDTDRWFDSVTSTNVDWTNGNDALFGGPVAANIVTLGSNISANSLTFNTNDYVVDLNGFDLSVTSSVAVAGSASRSTLTIRNDNLTTASTLNVAGWGAGQIAGPNLRGNLNVVYTGDAWLPIGTMDFTGTFSLLGSGLIRSDGVALGSPTGLLRLGGTHTLQLGTAAGQFRTFTRDIELLGNTASINPGGLRTLTLSGTISGSGEFRQGSSQGAIILTGNNTYSGGTYLTGAGLSLIAASNTAFGNSTVVETRGGSGGSVTASTIGFQGNVTIGSTAKIVLPGGPPGSGLGSLQNFGGDNSFAGNIELGSNTPRIFGVNANSSLTLSGEISQARGFTKIGAGTLILTGKNIYGTSSSAIQGGTGINAGILRLDFSQTAAGHDIDILNFNNASNTGATYLSLGGGTLEIKGRNGATNSQRFENYAGVTAGFGFTINPGASSIRAVQSGAASLSANLGQIRARSVGSTVDLTLPTSGAFTIPFGSGTAPLNTGSVNEIISANGSAFMTVDRVDWAARDASANVVAGASLPGFYTPNTADTLAGNADMSGPTMTTLTSTPLLSSLRFNNPGARTIEAGAQMLITGGILVTPNVANNVTTISGGSLTAPTAAANQDLVVIQNNPTGALVISSPIVDNAAATALTKAGSGILTLAGANTYTGTTTIAEGILKLNQAAALPGGTDATIGTGESSLTINGGVLGLTSDFSRAVGAGAGQVRFLGSGGFAAYGGDRTVNIGGSATPSALSWNATNFVPTMSDLILGAADADRTLIFQNPINTLAGASSPLNRTIRVENGLAAVDARMTGVISAEGGFIKSGTGTLDLAAANTYVGPTFVEAGELLVSGSLSASSPVSVQGGTLNVIGTGKVGGPLTIGTAGRVTGSSTPATGTSLAGVTLNAGGTIAPGVGVGTLKTGSATLNGGTLAFDIATDSSFDQLDVTGTVTLTSPVTLSLSVAAPLNNGSLLTLVANDGADPIGLADAASRLVHNNIPLNEGDIFTVTGAFGSQIFQLSYLGGTGNDIELVAVPEPASCGFLLGALVTLFGSRRLRSSRASNPSNIPPHS